MVGGAAEPEDGSFDSFDEAVDSSGGGVWGNRGEAPPLRSGCGWAESAGRPPSRGCPGRPRNHLKHTSRRSLRNVVH